MIFFGCLAVIAIMLGALITFSMGAEQARAAERNRFNKEQ